MKFLVFVTPPSIYHGFHSTLFSTITNCFHIDRQFSCSPNISNWLSRITTQSSLVIQNSCSSWLSCTLSQYIPRKSPSPQHLSKLVNKNTILNLNIASYFLNILASPDLLTWSTTGGAVKKTRKHLGLTRHHRHKVEIMWNMVNKCKEMDQEYTGSNNVTRNLNPPYLLSNLDELNILADLMENRIGLRYTTQLINCHR